MTKTSGNFDRNAGYPGSFTLARARESGFHAGKAATRTTIFGAWTYDGVPLDHVVFGKTSPSPHAHRLAKNPREILDAAHALYLTGERRSIAFQKSDKPDLIADVGGSQLRLEVSEIVTHEHVEAAFNEVELAIRDAIDVDPNLEPHTYLSFSIPPNIPLPSKGERKALRKDILQVLTEKLWMRVQSRPLHFCIPAIGKRFPILARLRTSLYVAETWTHPWGYVKVSGSVMAPSEETLFNMTAERIASKRDAARAYTGSGHLWLVLTLQLTTESNSPLQRLAAVSIDIAPFDRVLVTDYERVLSYPDGSIVSDETSWQS